MGMSRGAVFSRPKSSRTQRAPVRIWSLQVHSSQDRLFRCFVRGKCRNLDLPVLVVSGSGSSHCRMIRAVLLELAQADWRVAERYTGTSSS